MMKRILPLRLAAVLGPLAVALSAADKLDLSRVTPVDDGQTIPIQDFMRHRVLDDPVLNPAGTHLATLITDTEERSVAAVVDLKTNELEFFKVQDDRSSINGVVWLNDKRLLAFGYGLFTQDIGRMSDAYPLLRGTNATFVGVPRKDREHPLLWVGYGTESGVNDTGVTRINSSLNLGLALAARQLPYDTESAEINRRHIMTNFPRIEGVTGAARYYSDKDGELAFAIAGDDGFEKFYRFEHDKWLLCPVDLDAVFFIGVGNEKDQIVVCPRARTGKPLPLQFMHAATGQLGDVLIQDKAYDASTASLYRDRLSGIIVGATIGRGTYQTVWFDPAYKAVQKLIEGSFPGLLVRIIDNNEAGNLFLVATYSDRQPTVYHWVDVANHKAGLVKQSEPWINPKRMQPTSMIKYQTRDGRSIDAYVTMPAGASKANPPPLVVVPSPSEWGRLSWRYDYLAQHLASRGYAVLRPNHRGSPGYNWMFTEEDRYNFLGMADDIGDAAATFVKSGLVDGKRVAIMGLDFGAYFAIQGIERQPELYRCAVTINGFFDWGSLMAELKYNQYQVNSYAYYRRKLGDPKIEKEKYHLLSPLDFVAQAHAAVFVAHDKSDSDIYRAQSRKLVTELERNNLVHETYFAPDIWVPKERLASQLELYTRIEAFLAKHLLTK